MLTLLIFQDACLVAAHCAVLHYLYKDLRLLREDKNQVFSTEEEGVDNVTPTGVESGSMVYHSSRQTSRPQASLFARPAPSAAAPSGLELQGI